MSWQSKRTLRRELAAAQAEAQREREGLDRLLSYRVRVTSGHGPTKPSVLVDVPIGMMLMMTRERNGSETLEAPREGFNVEVGK